ncbi:MAG: RIP metalloprotease RseP [Methylotenera sp.]|nr:RIP metalloprotease RseP [Methylotenera sp.]
MLTALAFICTLGLLVTVHEYGHFQVAKWCGVKVLKFSIGFGRPLWSKKIGLDQTEFVLAAIPLGGFVKMLDEREFEQEASAQVHYSEAQLKRAFNRQTVAKRIAIVIAGPTANLLLAIILYSLLFMMGVVGLKPTLGKVVDSSPAASAKFIAGETIQKVNGKEVATWQELGWILLNESLKNTPVEVQAINSRQEIQLHQLILSSITLDHASKDPLSLLGLTIHQPKIPARIGEVINNSPADLAGFKANDLVLWVGDTNTEVKVWEDFVEAIRQHPNAPLDILVLRGANKVKLTVRPEPVIENGRTIGRIGAAFSMDKSAIDEIFVTTHYSLVESILKGTEKTWDTAMFSLKMLARMVTGQASWQSISGPVTIANYAGQSAHMGIKVFIGFLALISISMGVLNLLPIPVLDGGHLMYYMVEILTGKPVSESVMRAGQKIGFSMLGFMMIIAFYNDINRWITG